MSNNLKEKLRNYQPAPDTEVWNRVQQSLRRRTLLRRVGGFLLATAVVAAITLVLIPKGASPINQASESSNLNNVAQTYVEEENVGKPVNDMLNLEQAYSSASKDVAQASVERQNLGATTHVASDDETQKLIASHSEVSSSAEAPASTPVSEHRQTSSPVEHVSSPSVASQSSNPTIIVDNAQSSSIQASETTSSPQYSNNPENASVPITADETDLRIPNAFAPADDNEVNRFFRITTNTALTSFKLYIYNRGGRLVYHTTDINAYWNGTHNGTDVPQGAYVYVIQYSDQNGAPHTLKGTVTLIR